MSLVRLSRNRSNEEIIYMLPKRFTQYSPDFERWKDHAICTKEDSYVFFPERDDNKTTKERMRKICNKCPVQEACLEYSFIFHIKDGSFGGKTSAERRNIKRERTARGDLFNDTSKLRNYKVV